RGTQSASGLICKNRCQTRVTLIALAFKVGCVVYLFSLALLTVLFLVISVYRVIEAEFPRFLERIVKTFR
ncbi:hypothetical protein, partial [Turicimonas muris]